MARWAASTIGGNVGVSGSPMPSVITSTPAARFSAIRRSSWANRYGGMRSRRSLCLIELLAEFSGERPREDGQRPAGQGHVQMVPDRDLELTAVEADQHPRGSAGEVVSDGGAAGA